MSAFGGKADNDCAQSFMSEQFGFLVASATFNKNIVMRGAARFRRRISRPHGTATPAHYCGCTMRRCAMTKPYKYEGVLAQRNLDPTDQSKHMRSVRGEEWDQAIRRANSIFGTWPVRALFEDCGIPSNSVPAVRSPEGLSSAKLGWEGVALTLAERHVPAFQLNSGKVGRSRVIDELAMFFEVERKLRGRLAGCSG